MKRAELRKEDESDKTGESDRSDKTVRECEGEV